MSNSRKATLVTIASLVLAGIASRTFLHVAPNFELVTGLTLLSATRLSPRLSWLVPALIVLITDAIIGNTVILIFTWSGFAATYAIGRLTAARVINLRFAHRLLSYEILAVASVLLFYFWTNLGVVITSHMYAHSLTGYGQSLVMALPFLKTQILSVALTTPLLVVGYEVLSGKLKAPIAYAQRFFA